MDLWCAPNPIGLTYMLCQVAIVETNVLVGPDPSSSSAINSETPDDTSE